MAINRVAGPLLYSNLDRQGVDLQFTTGTAPLLYLDFAKFNVSINANTLNTTETFTVNGSARIGNTVIIDSTISSTSDLILTSTGNITIFPQGRLIAPHSNLGNLVVSDTTISSQGNIILSPANGITHISNLLVSGATINTVGNTQIGNLVINNNSIVPSLANAHISVAGTVVSDVGYPTLPTDAATVQFVIDHAGTITGNVVAFTQGDSIVALTDTTQPGKFIAILDSKLIATFANSYVTLAELTISSNTISSTGNVTLLPAIGSNVNVSGSVISNVGYPAALTDAATVQYVQNNISSFNPNLIFQGDSVVSIQDSAGPGGIVSVTVDGQIISTFTNNTATFANLSITGNSISGSGNVVITPAQSHILSINSNTAMQVPVGTSSDRPVSALPGYTRYNTTTGTLEVYDGANWISAQSSTFFQTLIGDNTTTTFALTHPSLAENMMVMINGVVQLPYTAYTTSGSNIIFAEPPLVSETIQIRTISLSVSSVSSVPTTIVSDPAVIILGNVAVALDTFSVNAYQSAKYTVSILFPSNNAQIADILVVHNRTTDAKYTVTASPVTGGSIETITYSTYLQSGMCVLDATSSVPGTRIKLQKTYFTI